MIPKDDSSRINRYDIYQLLSRSLVLWVVFCLFPPGITAQTASHSNPFGFVVSPEFSDVVEALRSDNYDLALELLSELHTTSVKAKSKFFRLEVLEATKQVKQLKREFEKVSYYYETLKSKPDDPEANEQVGKFYCIEKGDWAKGLPLLAKSDNRALLQTVNADLKQPNSPTKQAELADAWWRLAANEKGQIRKAYQLRGRYWFLLARPKLALERRLDRDKQLKQIALRANKLIIWNQHNGTASDRGTSECMVTLLYKGKSVWRQVAQLPWESDSPAGRVLRPPNVRFDRVRIDVTKIRGKGGGLGEVEVFDGHTNVAYKCSAVANGYWELNPGYHPNNVTDGDKSGRTGIWLLDNHQKGWVMIDMATFLKQQ